MHANFVHLRIHTAYSLSEGAIRVKELPGLCDRMAMPAVALTDTGNMFGALEASETLSRAGIQPIPGAALTLALAPAEDRDALVTLKAGEAEKLVPAGQIVLLAQSETGYRNLLELVSISFLETPDDQQPHIALSTLEGRTEGVICLTGGAFGPLGTLLAERRAEAAQALTLQLKALFGDRLYIELQRHGMPREAETETAMVELAYAHDIPLVATNEAFFPEQAMYEAHDALICIAEGAYVSQSDRRQLTDQHYFKSADEMAALFSDLPEAIDNTLEIAQRCAFRPHTSNPILPSYDSAEGLNEADELRRQAREGLARRLDGYDAPFPREDYEKRLDFELGVIETMGFPGYFLIVSDFIKWAKAHDIPVGPGRGSGAGSLVAYALTITDLDPLRFGLLFERFLNPERVSMPDFDIDFCQDRRDEVIQYVRDKYGADRVAQIITFGKLQARAVLRDVGRVLQMPYGQVDRLSKLVPNNPANPTTLPQAIADEPRLQEEARADETVDRLLTIGQQLEGLYRHASTHAAGVVIGDRPLQELVPIYRDPRSDMAVTQFNMKWVEPAGLVKFDFLGLKTLTVIERARQLLLQRGIDLDMSRLPLDDAATFALLGKGDTVGVFQLESSGMRDVMRRMKPDTFEDIIALVALYRPGPMDNIPKFIACKAGLEEPDYLHPMLEGILKETYGVIVYQEQVMQIAQILAGYSLGEADLLRRAMGKKIVAEMDKQRVRFVEGAIEKEVDKNKAAFIFDLVAKFAGYGFNKSHAACYALVAYQTAYLKANYPVEFMAALMTYDMTNTDKLGVFRQECLRLGVSVNPPDVNRSGADFTVREGEIFYALSAIKNVGRGAMETVEAERGKDGPYTDIFDFAARVDPKQFNKRAFENLARAGAFDSLNPNRRQVFESADTLSEFAGAAAAEKASDQVSLFGGPEADALARPKLANVTDWVPVERLSEEFGAVGFFLSGHPLDDYKKPLERAKIMAFTDLMAELERRSSYSARLAGTVTVKQERRSARTGNPFAFVKLTDPTGEYEVMVFSDLLRVYRDQLEPGNSIILGVEAEMEGETPRFTAKTVQSLDSVVAQSDLGLQIYVGDEKAFGSIAERLPGRGKGKVSVLCVLDGTREVELELPDRYAVTPQTRGAMMAVPGVLDVKEI